MSGDYENAELGAHPLDRAGLAAVGGSAGALLQELVDRWELPAAALAVGALLLYLGHRGRRPRRRGGYRR